MWNRLDLKCPEKDVCQYGIADSSLLHELPNLVSLLTTSAEIITAEHPIWTEIKVFQNVQTKYKRVLHCDKCLLLLQRVGSCLRKMVLLNLSACYLDLAERLLVGMQSQRPKTSLPSRQQLEFVLIRTQSAAKLICEALHYSRETFCYLIQRLRVGHLVLNLMMATSVTARVNILFKGLLVQLFDVYRRLYPWLSKLKRGTFEWPETLNLPEDLELWLQPEEAELLKPKHLPQDQLDFLTNYFNKKAIENLESDSESVCEIKGSDDDGSVIECSSEQTAMDTSNDLGEIISRDIIANKGSDDDDSVIECSPEQTGMDTSNDLGEIISQDNSSINERTNMMETSRNPQKVNLTQEQKILLNRITRAQTLKKLKNIWDNLDVSSPDLLPNSLTPMNVREVDKMFVELKRQIIQLKSMNLSIAERKKSKKSIIKVAVTRLAKHLGLVMETELSSKLKPVSKLKELRKLYQLLFLKLQSNQQYAKCYKLKKVFKSRRRDIKLLVENNERDIAKKLIFCTSKVFLTRYQI